MEAHSQLLRMIPNIQSIALGSYRVSPTVPLISRNMPSTANILEETYQVPPVLDGHVRSRTMVRCILRPGYKL